MSPVKETDREIDNRGIQADEFVFKPEPFLAHSLVSETVKKSQEEFLIERPGAVFVGIGQGGAARGRNSQMLQFAFAAFQATGDFSERVGSSQVAEEHGHELAPTSKPAGVAFGMSLFDGPMEFISWKEL